MLQNWRYILPSERVESRLDCCNLGQFTEIAQKTGLFCVPWVRLRESVLVIKCPLRSLIAFLSRVPTDGAQNVDPLSWVVD